MTNTHPSTHPKSNCSRCPRLVANREEMRQAQPDWHNDPVPSFGNLDAMLLVVGLAPGRAGANRTGRPFTGDAAGDVLYPALIRHGFASGAYGAEITDGLTLVNCRITNAVRCLPPGNKPTSSEVTTCRSFLAAELTAMPRLAAVLALGRIAHHTAVAALGESQAVAPFGHGAIHHTNGIYLCDSYHCSRYNINTGRLTIDMFDSVLTAVSKLCRN